MSKVKEPVDAGTREHLPTHNGQCHACGNNKFIIRELFAWYEPGEFWYCCYCGSEDVEVKGEE